MSGLVANIVVVILGMHTLVQIDLKRMEHALKVHVRNKALKAGSRIVYVEGGQLILEDLKANTKDVRKRITPRT